MQMGFGNPDSAISAYTAERDTGPAPARGPGDRGAEAALSGPFKEREAPARERLAASLLGEHAVEGAVEFDEPVSERDQCAGFQGPLDEVPPAQRDAMPGGSSFQHVGVAVESEAAQRPVRVPGDRKPVLPRRPALVVPQLVDKRQPAPAGDRPGEGLRVGGGVGGRADGSDRLPGANTRSSAATPAASQVSRMSADGSAGRPWM